MGNGRPAGQLQARRHSASATSAASSLASCMFWVLKKSLLRGGRTWGVGDMEEKRAEGSGHQWLEGFPQRWRCRDVMKDLITGVRWGHVKEGACRSAPALQILTVGIEIKRTLPSSLLCP